MIAQLFSMHAGDATPVGTRLLSDVNCKSGEGWLAVPPPPRLPLDSKGWGGCGGGEAEDVQTRHYTHLKVVMGDGGQ